MKGPVSVEVLSTDLDGMLREGREYAGWHKHVVVKLPTTREGIKGCKALSSEGIKVNMTLCFSPNQALIIAKAGAVYCSPFVGTARRHQRERHAADPRHQDHLHELRIQDGDSCRLAAASVACG